MAADLGQLRVSIDAQQALATAQQLAQALKVLGAQGQQTVTDLAALQAVAAKPIGGGTGSTQAMIDQTAKMVAGMRQAQQLYQAMATEGAGPGAFGEAATQAQILADALGSAIGVFRDMVTQGADVREIMATLTAQIAEMPDVFKQMSEAEKQAFNVLQEESTIAVERTRQYQNSVKDLGTALGLEAKQMEQAVRQQQQLTNIQRQAREETARSPIGGAASTLTSAMMTQQMLSSGGMMNSIFGFQQLSTTIREAQSGVQVFGTSFAGMLGVVGGAAAAFAAALAAINAVKDAIVDLTKSGSELQQTQLKLNFIGGGAALPGAATGLEQMSALSGLKLDDIISGLRILSTQGLPVTNDEMVKVGNTATAVGQSMTNVATKVIMFDEAIQNDRKNIDRVVDSMERENIISGELGNTIIRMRDQGASWQAIQEKLIDGMTRWDGAMQKSGSTLQGLARQLNQLQTLFKETAGTSFVQTFTPPLSTINAFGQAFTTEIEKLGTVFGNSLIGGIMAAAAAFAANPFSGPISAVIAFFTAGFIVAIQQIAQQFEVEFESAAIRAGNAFVTAPWVSTLLQIPGLFSSELAKAISGMQAQAAAASTVGSMVQAYRGPHPFAEQMFLPAPVPPSSTTPFLGGGAGGGKSPKEAKEDWSALNNVIKEVSDAEKEAADNVKLYDTEVKAGMMSAETAAQLKLKAYQDEMHQFDDLAGALQKQQELATKAVAAEVAAGDTSSKKYEEDKAALDKVNSAIVAFNTHIAETKVAVQQLGLGTFFENFKQGINEATAAWGTFGQQTIQLGKQMTDELASGLGNAMTQIWEGTGKLSDAFRSMADSIIKSIDDMIAKMIIQWAWEQITGLLGGSTAGAAQVAGSGASAVLHAQVGGLVSGPTGTDRVPASLTAGEFVISQRAVDKYGLAMIQAINSGTWQPGMSGPKFAGGGFVSAGSSAMNTPPSMNPAGAGSSSQNFSIVTNVTIPGGASTGQAPGQQGLSSQQIDAFQKVLEDNVKSVIIRERRPGGLLSRQQLS